MWQSKSAVIPGILICALALSACSARTAPEPRALPISPQPSVAASRSSAPAVSADPESDSSLNEIWRVVRHKAGRAAGSNPVDAVDVEPRRDVRSGTYLVRILNVRSTRHGPTIRFDIVTNDFVPKATRQDRKRSSWDEWIGWNKHPHRQTLPLSADAALVVGGDTFSGWTLVNVARFTSRWDDLTPDQNYFVHIAATSGGRSKVVAIWPWIK
jgi:hypothetical protein